MSSEQEMWGFELKDTKYKEETKKNNYEILIWF